MRTQLNIYSYCFLFLFLVSFSVTAQYKFPGYYINQKRDTVRGSVDYKQWSSNPSEIYFNDGKISISLKPEEIKSVYVTDYDTYVSYIGTRLLNKYDVTSSNISEDSTNNFESINTFLQLVYSFNGFKIFSYKDNQRTNLFYQLYNLPITELLVKVYSVNGRAYSINTFHEQIFSLFKSEIQAAKLNTQLENLGYEENSLIQFIKKIQNNKTKKKAIYPSRFFAGAGTTLNHIAVGKVQASPLINAGINFYSQRDFASSSFSPQVLIFPYKSYAVYDFPIIQSQEYSGFAVVTSLLWSYNFINKSEFKWWGGIGTGIMFAFDSKTTIHTGNSPSYVLDEGLQLKGYGTIRSGFTIKSINIWGGYSPSSIKRLKNGNFEIAVEYVFKRKP